MNRATKADVLLGLQWGDEGKGKIVDVFAPQYDLIARFQGGPNAGHTIEFGKKKYVLHTIPSGIFHRNSKNLIGSGVVIDPLIFEKELKQLSLDVQQIHDSLVVSVRAHLILPSHRLLDAAMESAKGNHKIGSTLKGIGPAYTDKIARTGVRVADLTSGRFSSIYALAKENHLRTIQGLGYSPNDFKIEGESFDEYESRWMDSLERLKSLPCVESELYINRSLDQGLKVLAEGAQGTLLDIDFGSYPFVTSSNTITAGACTGLGIAPSRVGEVFGIFKAYCTRVGNGPFPTELRDTTGDLLRKEGNEFGATTGRPRRCGWLDLPALKYSVMINGATRLIMTKVDVLGILEQIKVCIAYEYDGSTVEFLPTLYHPDKVQPVFAEFKGWQCDLKPFIEYRQLPASLKAYVKFIEDFVKVPIEIVSTGPDRTQTLFR